MTDDVFSRIDKTKTLIVFDEVCVLCNGFIQFIVRHDKRAQFQFASAQGEVGQSLYKKHNLPTVDFETNLVFTDGVLHTKLNAFIVCMETLGGVFRVASVLRVLPRRLADWLYDRIAKNRYAVFGRYETCPIPDADLRARLL